MDLQFKDKRLEKLCTDEREMRRRRPDLQKKLRLRINALRSAKTLGELPVIDPGGRWHRLTGNLAGIWSGDVSGNYRLLVEPDPVGSLEATRAIVMEIRDTH